MAVTAKEIPVREGGDSVEAVSSRTASAHESHAQQKRRTAFIASLRACADFLDAHPDVEPPTYTTMNVFVQTRAQLAVHARVATWDKIYNGDWFYLRRAFGEDLNLDITIARDEVCRKVVTGTRVVPAQPERTVDEVEWVCDTPTLAEGR